MLPTTKNLKTESIKKYSSGFALTESELRRLHELLVQQIKRTPIGDEFKTSYELKYRNGSVAYPATLDDVLAQENFGSAGILRLTMEVFDKEEKPSNMIGIQFRNPTEEESAWDLKPISFNARGEDRDWVFLTSSQLDERVGKIARFSPDRLLSRKGGLGTMLTLFSALPLLFLAMMFSGIYQHSLDAVRRLDALEGNWKAGNLKDPVEASIQIGRIGLESSRIPIDGMLWPLMVIFGVFFALVVSWFCYKHFYPSYNFLWGDYLAVYEKRRSKGNILFVGILLTLALGILVNFISKRIGLYRFGK
ncbi:MAG: hypothetical protein ABSE51_18680 [Terracidiphilus sp.]|jgi:hypothetical protein